MAHLGGLQLTCAGFSLVPGVVRLVRAVLLALSAEGLVCVPHAYILLETDGKLRDTRGQLPGRGATLN